MAMFHLLKIRTSLDIFQNEKCKVTFGFEYIWTICTLEDLLFIFWHPTPESLPGGVAIGQNSKPF